MDARVNYVILPLAQSSDAAGPGGARRRAKAIWLASCTRSAHGLGPAFARRGGKQMDIREAIGRSIRGLEEAKADVVGMFGLEWLMDHGALPKDRSEEYYASYLAGIFRTVRFGTGEAHGRAEMMEFNYLLEQGAIRREDREVRRGLREDARRTGELAKELLEMEATEIVRGPKDG